MPYFSIVIPTYNRSKHLEETLASIRTQTFDDFEVIVVDDGSTDNTPELLHTEAAKDQRLRSIRQENSERGAARNEGWKNATGKYVVFFDSDDLMLPHYLETLHQYIASHEEGPAIIACKLRFRGPKGERPHPNQRALKGTYDHSLFLEGNPLACHFAVCNEPERFQLFEEDRSFASMEDWMFLVTNARRERVHILDRECVIMLQHDQRSMIDHQKVIDTRSRALSRLLESGNFTAEERSKLVGRTLFFNAIHALDDGQRKQSLQLTFHAIALGVFDRFVVYHLVRLVFGNRIARGLRSSN